MTERILVVGSLVAVAVVIALLVQRRRPAAPTNPTSYQTPVQLDRADFEHPEVPWLVVVFSSLTCDSCAGVWARAEPLRSSAVAVVEVEATRDAALHQRYGIEAVPITVVADREGVVRRSFVGPVSSTHLWAALADLRDPGSVPPGCEGHDHVDSVDSDGPDGPDGPTPRP